MKKQALGGVLTIFLYVLTLFLALAPSALAGVRSCSGGCDHADRPVGAISEPARVPQPAFRISWLEVLWSLL
jgi:hypothetical protein